LVSEKKHPARGRVLNSQGETFRLPFCYLALGYFTTTFVEVLSTTTMYNPGATFIEIFPAASAFRWGYFCKKQYGFLRLWINCLTKSKNIIIISA
jgi:hypothetical protein